MGGKASSEFDAEVLAFVAGVSDLAYRLEQRGWLGLAQGSGSDLAWDWPATGDSQATGTGSGHGEVFPCTSVTVDEDSMSVLVSLVGQPDRPGGDLSVAPDALTDNALAELEAHRPEQAVPTWLQPS